MRTTTIGLAAALVAGVALLPFAAASHSMSGNYDTATTPGLSLVWCPLGNDGGPCIGGVQFSADQVGGHTPRSTVFSDASGGDVHFTICQDFDGNSICGEAGEPTVAKCGTSGTLSGAGSESEVPFSGAFGIATFIRIWDPDCPATVATTGSVTVSTA